MREFEIYNPTSSNNVALKKTATANSYNSPGEAPSYAVDGSTASKWTSIAASPNWLQVDLG